MGKNSTQGIMVVMRTLYALIKGYCIGVSVSFSASFSFNILAERAKGVFQLQDTFFPLLFIVLNTFEYTISPLVFSGNCFLDVKEI